MKIINTILNVIFPSICVICGEKDVDLCTKCLTSFPPAERESPNWIFSIYDYAHPDVRKSIKLLKYKNRKKLSKTFAEIMYPRILEELSDLFILENFRNVLLIPIPLSRKRIRERGFNQSELICRELIKLNQEKTFKLIKNVLIKPKDGIHQAHIKNRQQRLKNIQGSFILKNKNLIQGKNIILIDDIATTGATLAEARKTLQQGGARKIIAFTIAH